MPPRRPRDLAAPLVGTAVIAGVCAYALAGVDPSAVANALRRMSPALLAAAALVFLGESWLRAHALAALLAPIARVPPSRLFRYVCVSRAAAAALPWRFGDVAPVLLLRAREGVAPEAAVAVLLAEKASAALTLALLAAPLPLLFPLPRAVSGLAAAMGLGAAVVGAALFVAGSGATWLHRWPIVARFAAGAAALRRPRTALFVLATSLVQWVADALAIHLCLRAAGLTPHVYSPVLMEVLSTAAGLVPSLAPAHLGSFEGGVVAALALVGARGEATFAFALALHATQVIPVALAGLLALRGAGGIAALRGATES